MARNFPFKSINKIVNTELDINSIHYIGQVHLAKIPFKFFS